MKRYFAIIAAGLLIASFAGCKSREERPQKTLAHAGMKKDLQTVMPDTAKKERTVVVPDDVKATWKAITLFVEDRAAKTTTEYAVEIGSSLTVPNTNMTITVLAFLPDFRMNEREMTTASNKPNNPAAQVLIQERGKQDWKGWLYSKHPDVHSYPHEKIGILLVCGITK